MFGHCNGSGSSSSLALWGHSRHVALEQMVMARAKSLTEESTAVDVLTLQEWKHGDDWCMCVSTTTDLVLSYTCTGTVSCSYMIYYYSSTCIRGTIAWGISDMLNRYQVLVPGSIHIDVCMRCGSLCSTSTTTY